jgi:WhiB family redox-sensing transcriptional regulator
MLYHFDTYRRLPDWQNQKCFGKQKLFFPEVEVIVIVQEAKTICSECTIRSKCLQFALSEDMEYGIWGGMTRIERRRMRKLLNGQTTV